MDTPENTLLVVLQVVALILTLLMFVGARQARSRDGVWFWVAVFARLEVGDPASVGSLCMDLDHFKAVNDIYGHGAGAGDDVPCTVGKLIQDNARPNDMPSRPDGEEFGGIVDTDSEVELLAPAKRMRAAVARAPFPTRAGLVAITVSIGVALARGAGESLEALGERADHSLLEAKRSGRNLVVFADVHADAVAV